ncbi:MAG TPA: helix-turn-helix transcriptional regulator [Ktedonobacterales bacterium]|nr:helix-turn-helix transcriptional regulator [Ktedonobacterales bacterium]
MITLRRLREEAAYSLSEVAQGCGVRRQTVWQWENAKARPSPAHRRKLAEFFKCEPKEILAIVEATEQEFKERAAA